MALDLDGVSDTNCADWEAFAFSQCRDDEDGEEDSPEGHPPPSSEGTLRHLMCDAFVHRP